MQNNFYKPLIEAIPARHSVRTFLPEAIPTEKIADVQAFAEALQVPFQHSTAWQFFVAEPGKKLYNNGVNPVNNLAFLSQTDIVSISKTGFIGELVMLYAVSIGLDTCWFGHYKLAEVGRYIENIATKERVQESTLGYGYGNHVNIGERVICCMPFGQADAASKRLIDRIMKKLGGNRKPLQELLQNPEQYNDIPQDVKDVLELAKLAPSAGNSQPWRFAYEENTSTITVAKPEGYKHFKWEHSDVDISMCAAHVWLGLLEKGYTPKVSVTLQEDRAVWAFQI